MITMPFRYETNSESRSLRRVIEAQTVTNLARVIVEAERDSNFAVPVFSGHGTLTVPPGQSHTAAMRFIVRAVRSARRDFEARAGSVGPNSWALVAEDPRHEVIFAPTARELARAAATWSIVKFVSIAAHSHEVDEAVQQIVNGRLYHGGREVNFDEPIVDRPGRTLEHSALWFVMLERAVRHCKVAKDQIRDLMIENAKATIECISSSQARTGIIERIERNAVDDQGARHDYLAVVDVGADDGRPRRLSVATKTSESPQQCFSRIRSLIGKEIEFDEYQDGKFLFDQVPSCATGLSKAARDREVEEPEFGR